jgi:hypothetical protein
MLCNDHVGQNMVVDNNVINDSIQQTTDQFPPSFPQTMVSAHAYSNLLRTMSIELASVCITHWIKKFYVFVYQFISSIFKMFIVKQTDNNGRFRWNSIVMDQPK